MRHYKKDEFEGRNKEKETLLEEFEHDVWDIKKIFVGIVMFAVFIGAGIYAAKTFHLLPDASYIFSTKVPRQAVAGVSTQAENAASASGSQTLLNPQQKLDQLKQQVNNLNVQDIVQNSPQVQKLQHDLQSLTSIPGDAAKKECIQICNGL